MKNNFLKKIFVFIGLFVVVTLCSSQSALVQKAAANTNETENEVLDLLPPSDSLLLINVHQLISSSIYQTAGENLEFKNMIDELQSTVHKYGATLEQINYIAMAPAQNLSKNTKAELSTLLVINGSFDQTQILEAIKKPAGKSKIKTEDHGGTTIYMLDPDSSSGEMSALRRAMSGKLVLDTASETVALAFINPQSIAIGGRASVIQALDTRAGKIPTIKNDPDLIRIFNETDSTSSIRFAGVLPNSFRKEIESLMNKDKRTFQILKPFLGLTSVLGYLDLTDEIRFATTFRTSSPTDAKPIYDQLNGLLAVARLGTGGNNPEQKAIAEMLDQVSIVDKGGDIQVFLNIPKSILQIATSPKKITK